MIDVFSGQTASMEDYLEAIALLGETSDQVKVSEISKFLEVKKPSVTAALTKLKNMGLVSHKKYGEVKLTRQGIKIARDVYHRHNILRSFLADILGVDSTIAEKDACGMEHSLSKASLDRLAMFVKFIFKRADGEGDWLKTFNNYYEYDNQGDMS
jgi:DtxR family Mn-dependent transcriptional regulator